VHRAVETAEDLLVNPDGSFEFIPDPDWYGIVNFEYWVFDGLEHSNVVTVTITVNPVNDSPVALDDAYIMEEDGILQASFAVGVLANDYDVDGDFLEAYFAELPSNGILSFNLDGSFTYTPNPDFWGVDSFRYLVYDGIDASDLATVTITVSAVKDAPVAVDDFYVTDEDTDLSTYGAGMAGVLANDYDGDGDPLEAILVEYPLNGLLTFDPDGNFLYVPDANFWGTDSFTYLAYDGVDYSNIATVTIMVNSVNDPPVSVDDAYTVEEDGILQVDYADGVLANDYDADGDFLEVYFLDLPSNGALSLSLDGSFTYIPDPNFWGVDSFTYLAYDGIDAGEITTVTITVNPVDDPSVAVDDYVVTEEDAPIIIDVTANDYDVEGDSFFVADLSWTDPQPYGQLALVRVDGVWMIEYTPNPDWHGEAWFIYHLYKYSTAESQLQDSGYVYVTVNSVPDSPVAEDDSYTMDEDNILQIYSGDLKGRGKAF